MLVVKVILVVCFLCVGFLCNWLNADRSQNCEKIDRNIPSIFRLSVVVRKYCYTSDTKQVPPQLKFKNLLLLLLLCGDVASNPGPTNFGFINCRSIRNKGPLLHGLCGDLDILGLVETHIRPHDTDGLLSSLTPADYNFIQKPRLMPLFHQKIKPRSCLGPLIVHSRWKKDKNGREYWVGIEVWG